MELVQKTRERPEKETKQRIDKERERQKARNSMTDNRLDDAKEEALREH